MKSADASDTQDDELSRVNEVRQQLAAAQIPYRERVLGSDLTTFKIGGALALLIEPRSVAETVLTFGLMKRSGCVARILGEGSNLLIPDAGLTSLIVRPRGRELLVSTDGCVEVEAGYPLMSLARQMSEAGWAGLEFAGGIPGSVGGAAFMNAGAHGSCMREVIEWVELASYEGIQRVRAGTLPWSYRESGIVAALGAHGGAVLKVGLRLRAEHSEITQQRRAQFLAHRRTTQPLQAASAGSVFRNPSATLAAGAVIERCGLKGLACGGALVSPLHANWIINPERTAQAHEVLSLIERIKTTVMQQEGIRLVEELVQW